MKRMTAMMTAAALCLGVCSLPAAAETEKNFEQDFFPDGFTQTPSVHHILLDNNEESFWIEPTFANSQEVYDFLIAWQNNAAMCEAYGLEDMSLVMQIDYRIDDGEWQYDAAWDEGINGCDFYNGICWPHAGDWLCDNATVLGGSDENMAEYENIKDALVWVYNDYHGYDCPNFDDENHTVTFRARYMLQYTDSETYETQAFFSGWSEEQSIGKDGNQGELTAPTALPAPQISNLQVLTEVAGNYYMTFELFYPIEMAYADYYYYNMNSWYFDYQGTVGDLYAEININNTGWQEVAVIDGYWFTGGTRIIDSEDTDDISFTDYDYIQLRVRQRHSEPLTNSYSNIISINSIELRLGDVSADGIVNATDAAMILVAAAAVGAGSESGLTQEQERVAKVMGNESFSATDAAMILTYAAAAGADFKGTLEEFMAQGGEEVGTTAPTTTETIATTTQTTVTTTTTETTTTSATIDPDDYRLEDIKTNAGAFSQFSSGLNGELLKNNGVQMSYGVTFGARETDVLLALLNDGQISDEVIKYVFGSASAEDIKNSIEFIYFIDRTEGFYGTRIDYSKYTLDKEIGNYINQISDANANDNIDEFVLHTFTPQAVPEKITHNTAVLAMSAAYDNQYVTQAIANGLAVDEFVNKLTQLALGDSDAR